MRSFRHLALLFSLTLCLSLAAVAQTPKPTPTPTPSPAPTKIYYDKYWKRIKSAKDAEYYRIVTLDREGKPVGIVTDHYITGERQWQCKLLSMDMEDANKNVEDGTCTWYRKDGSIESVRSFIKGAEEGVSTWYRADGSVESMGTYSKGLAQGPYTEFYKSGKISLQVKYVDGLRVRGHISCDEFGKCEKVFFESLRDTSDPGQWALGNATLVEDKGLVAKPPVDKVAAQATSVDIDPSTDFSLSVDLQQTEGVGNSANGLLFGFGNKDNYLYFFISSNGGYMMGSVVKGLRLPFKEWTNSTAINRGSQENRILVRRMGKRFIFAINGTVVENFDALPLMGTNFLLWTDGEPKSKEVVFKNFQLSVPDDGSSLQNISVKPISSRSGTAGFFIDPSGYLVTNSQITENSSEFEVVVSKDGVQETFAASLVVADRQNDLAVLRIEDPKYTNPGPLPYIVKTGPVNIGADVFTLGSPGVAGFTDETKAVGGQISNRTGFKGDVASYEVGLGLRPEDNGSPLFDSEGNVIGVMNAKVAERKGVSYSTKTNYLMILLDSSPEKITIPEKNLTANLTQQERVRQISRFVVLVRAK